MPGGPGPRPLGIHPSASQYYREKLNGYIYEYLCMTGAQKSAEAFKIEVLANMPNVKSTPPPPDLHAPFLAEWFELFMDIYNAAPDRREEFTSQESKLFHDLGLVPSTAPNAMMNGMHPQFGAPPSQMLGPGPEGMMPGFPGPGGRFAGASRGLPSAPPHPSGMPGAQFYDPRMGGRGVMPPPGARGPGGPSPAGSFPGLRPGGPPPNAMPPQGMRYGAPFMDGGAGGAPPPSFPCGISGAPNGGVMCTSAPGAMGTMSSPGGMPPMPGGPPGSDPRYAMMMPSSSQSLQFGMSQAAQQQQNAGPPLPGAVPGGPDLLQVQHTPGHTPSGSGQGMQDPSGGRGTPGGGGVPQSTGPIAGLLNGADIKHSPASTPRGNGGTPAGGPGSAAPSSVHSQGGVGSVSTPAQQRATTPATGVEPMDTQQHPEEEQNEITKIKNSLIDDYEGRFDVNSAQYSEQ